MTRVSLNRFLPALCLLLAAAPASAHTGSSGLAGFAGGLLHPATGLDHLFALLAIGVWAGQQQRQGAWQASFAVLIGLLAGGALAGSHVALPLVEPALALSVLVAGLMVAAAWRAPATGTAIAAAFAVFHGYAHGIEMPGEAQPAAYVAGFALTTAILLAAGATVGRRGWAWTRAAGAAVAAAGGVLLWFA
jgi:urease accessory protein